MLWVDQHCMQLREKKGSVKIWELDSNNRNGDRDSSDESNIDESSDPLRRTEILSMRSWLRTVVPPALSFACFLRPAALACFLEFVFVFPHFAGPAERKAQLQKNYLPTFGALSALRNTSLYLLVPSVRTKTAVHYFTRFQPGERLLWCERFFAIYLLIILGFHSPFYTKML